MGSAQASARIYNFHMSVIQLSHGAPVRSISYTIILGMQGKSEEMLRQVLELREKVYGKEHPSTLVSMDDLASVLSVQGKHEAAEEIKGRIQDIREKKGQVRSDKASAKRIPFHSFLVQECPRKVRISRRAPCLPAIKPLLGPTTQLNQPPLFIRKEHHIQPPHTPSGIQCTFFSLLPPPQ